MTPTETTTILRQFNVWRRGADIPQPDPREIGEAIDAAVEMIERLEAAEKERDALRAKVERMERQEPVGWFARIDGDGPLMECKHADIPSVPLYALPGAQAQPALAAAPNQEKDNGSI